MVARRGRNGQWSGWLKERKISRATADRLVSKYERSLNPDTNRLTESISEPSDEEIQNLLDKITPKLNRVLRTPASVYRFLDLLSSSFDGVYRRVTEEGLMIVKPAEQTAVVQHVREAQSDPVVSSVEPVTVIADALAEGNSASMETSAA